MTQIPSIIIVIVFMVILSLVINFIGNTFLELACAISDRIVQKKSLNNRDLLQYDNTGDDNDMDAPEVTV